jgi:hypothetical protein
MQPWNADSIALFDYRDACTDRGHAADALMSRDERQLGLHRPITVRRVDICMAHSAKLRLHENFADTWVRDIPFPQNQRPFELLDHRDVHF